MLKLTLAVFEWKRFEEHIMLQCNVLTAAWTRRGGRCARGASVQGSATGSSSTTARPPTTPCSSSTAAATGCRASPRAGPRCWSPSTRRRSAHRRVPPPPPRPLGGLNSTSTLFLPIRIHSITLGEWKFRQGFLFYWFRYSKDVSFVAEKQDVVNSTLRPLRLKRRLIRLQRAGGDAAAAYTRPRTHYRPTPLARGRSMVGQVRVFKTE